MTLCSWEGNRWSGITQAMHYRVQFRKVDKHPACAPLGVWQPLPRLLVISILLFAWKTYTLLVIGNQTIEKRHLQILGIN